MTDQEQPTTPTETPKPTLGTTELKELLTLVLDGVAVGVDAAKDGKIDFADVPLVFRLIPDLGPAFSNVGQVPAELADLTQEEAADVVAFVMSKLALDDAKARAVIVAALKTLASGYELVQALRA